MGLQSMRGLPTGIYLLVLAVAHSGRFVTFDIGIALAAARNATT